MRLCNAAMLKDTKDRYIHFFPLLVLYAIFGPKRPAQRGHFSPFDVVHADLRLRLGGGGDGHRDGTAHHGCKSVGEDCLRVVD